jgi:valyl-tRNA synthetase
MIAPWPEAGDVDHEARAQMEVVMEIIRSIRAVRSEHRVDAGAWVSAMIVAGSQEAAIAGQTGIIERLARVRPVSVTAALERPPEGSVSVTAGRVQVHLPLRELIDPAAERTRLEKEIAESERLHLAAQAKLANQGFTSRAPANVVERERERAASLAELLTRLRDQLAALRD